MSSAVVDVPRVRVVVVNYNGGRLVERCVEHLTKTDWPREKVEIVVVDNASSDGSADAIATRFPSVQVVKSPDNRGFAGGNNIALRDLGDVEFVALVNSDAFVEPGWLAPLVDGITSAPDIGAANAKLLLEPRFVAVDIRTDTFVPGGDDTRTLGIRVHDVECAGTDVWKRCLFPTGFHGPEFDENAEHFRWSEGAATLWVGLPGDTGPGVRLRLKVSAERAKQVKFDSRHSPVVVDVGPEPRWVELVTGGPAFDVINNAGNILVEGGWGADRGFRQLDEGQYEEPAEVFAWCGAAVVLKRSYLEDVGIFDDHFFLYYEDFDLSWRGRLRGWRYLYVPDALARHVHAATTVEGSALFDHYVQRNRLLTLVKNAPSWLVRQQLYAYVKEVSAIAHREVVRPTLRGHRPHPDYTRRRLRSLAAFVKHLPKAVAERRRIGRRARVDRDHLMEWSVPHP